MAEIFLGSQAIRIIEKNCRFVDALAEWDKHKGVGRFRRPKEEFEGHAGFTRSIDLVLNYRHPVLWRILQASPIGCLRVELKPEIIPRLRI